MRRAFLEWQLVLFSLSILPLLLFAPPSAVCLGDDGLKDLYKCDKCGGKLGFDCCCVKDSHDGDCASAKQALKAAAEASPIGLAGPYKSDDVDGLSCSSAEIAAEIYAHWKPASEARDDEEKKLEHDLTTQIGDEQSEIGQLFQGIVNASKAKAFAGQVATIIGTIAKEINPSVGKTGLGIGGDDLGQALANFKSNLGDAFNPMPQFIRERIGQHIAALMAAADGKAVGTAGTDENIPIEPFQKFSLNASGSLKDDFIDINVVNKPERNIADLLNNQPAPRATKVIAENSQMSSDLAIDLICQAESEELKGAAMAAEADKEKDQDNGPGPFELVAPAKPSWTQKLQLHIMRPLGKGNWYWEWDWKKSDWEIQENHFVLEDLNPNANDPNEKQFDAQPPDSTKPHERGPDILQALLADAKVPKSSRMAARLKQLQGLKMALQQCLDKLKNAQ